MKIGSSKVPDDPQDRSTLGASLADQAGGLCFDTRDDALNFAKQSVEDSNRWFAAQCPRAYRGIDLHRGRTNTERAFGWVKRHARRAWRWAAHAGGAQVVSTWRSRVK